MTNLHVCHPTVNPTVTNFGCAPDIMPQIFCHIYIYVYSEKFITNVHQNIIIRMLLIKNTLYDLQ